MSEVQWGIQWTTRYPGGETGVFYTAEESRKAAERIAELYPDRAVLVLRVLPDWTVIL